MTVHRQESPPSYLRALEAAHALGRADGRLEAELIGDPAVDPGPAALGPRCRGLDPERFAALVWGAAGGAAPAGVVLNAPLWYVQGFREALAWARPDRHPAAADPSGPCPPPTPGRPPRAADVARGATAPVRAGLTGWGAVSAWRRPRRRR